MSTTPLLPLPVKPAPPVLLAQDASAHAATTLAESIRWRYRVRYRHQHAAQDEVWVTAEFNLSPQADDIADTTAAGVPTRSEYRFVAQLVRSADSTRIEALRLSRAQEESGSAGSWPRVEFFPSDALIVDAGEGLGDDMARSYAFDPPLASGEEAYTIGLSWDWLDLIALQNARASLQVVRNRGLIAAETTPALEAYRTARVDAADIVAPFNRMPRDFDIGELGATVKAALDEALCILFRERWPGQPLSLSIAYGFTPTPATDPGTTLPVLQEVLLLARQPIATDSTALVAADLQQWREAHAPKAQDGHWSIALTLYSQVDSRQSLPLLVLDRLVFAW